MFAVDDFSSPPNRRRHEIMSKIRPDSSAKIHDSDQSVSLDDRFESGATFSLADFRVSHHPNSFTAILHLKGQSFIVLQMCKLPTWWLKLKAESAQSKKDIKKTTTEGLMTIKSTDGRTGQKKGYLL